MNILITGASGYIGKKLVCRLYEENHTIIVISRKSSNLDEIRDKVSNIIYCESYEEMSRNLQEFRIDFYINTSGYYSATSDLTHLKNLCDANILFPLYVTEAVLKSGCRHVIHTASYQQCYNGETYHPINLYAATKQAFEDLLYYYSSSKQINTLTLQLFDTYGADDKRNKVFNYVRRLKNGENIEMSPGMQKLYFCYIDDVIEGYMVAINLLIKKENGYQKRYALRPNEPIRLKEFVEKYLEENTKVVDVFWGKRNYMQKEIMDPTGYGEILPGWEAKISYTQGLRYCSDFDKENN